MPISNKEIAGLADEILNHYGDYEDIRKLQMNNLYNHLKDNGIKDAEIVNRKEEVIFSMSNW